MTSEPLLPLDLPQTELARLWPTPVISDAIAGPRPSNTKRGQAGLTSSVAVSPARISVSLAPVAGSTPSAPASGTNMPASLASFDPATSSWKTSQRCFLTGWAEFSQTWPRSGLMRSGIAYRLPPLVPLIGGTASGLLPTPPTSAQNTQSVTSEHRERPNGICLADAVRVWPPPTAQDAANNAGPSQFDRNSLPLNAAAGGALNPTWVEWLMGFPLGWTDCGVLETRSSRKSSR
jgi:hypothetical protein